MSSAVLQNLVSLSWVTTLAALAVALARVALRGALGARAAYGLWLTVPASAVALAVPHAGQPRGPAQAVVPHVISWAWARLDALLAAMYGPGPVGAVACAVWVTGAAAAFVFMVRRQSAFARSLGTLVPAADGTWRSRGVTEPLLLGAWRPRVLVPLDFEQRFGVQERELVLAHERTHMRRGDTRVNAACTAWLCVFWFNPVMFWAMRLLRFDQDLACDAAVLALAGRGSRGRYAEALLKAQLAGEARLPLPLTCHWHSVHPLRRRIAALKRPAAGRIRHGVGIICVAMVVGSVCVAARAVEPAVRVAPSSPSSAAASPARARLAHSSNKVCPLTRHRAHAGQQIQSSPPAPARAQSPV